MMPSLFQQNGFAVASMVLAFLCWPLGALFGHLARRRAYSVAGAGAGLAVVALIISYSLGFASFLLLMIHLAQGPSPRYSVGP
jgi:hypothetical protein